MRNFHINPEGYQEPASETHLYDIGTSFSFRNIGGQLRAVLQIPVQYA